MLQRARGRESHGRGRWPVMKTVSGGRVLTMNKVVRREMVAKFATVLMPSRALGFAEFGFGFFFPLEVWASCISFVSLVIWLIELMTRAGCKGMCSTGDTYKIVKARSPKCCC